MCCGWFGIPAVPFSLEVLAAEGVSSHNMPAILSLTRRQSAISAGGRFAAEVSNRGARIGIKRVKISPYHIFSSSLWKLIVVLLLFCLWFILGSQYMDL